MKRRSIISITGIVFLFLQVGQLIGNDGVFYASGNTLIPLENTSIELKEEYLNLTFNDGDILTVDIQFKFYNPGPEQELLVGFVTPPAGGAIVEEEENHPRITDFKVLVDNQLLDYNIYRLSETEFSKLVGTPHGNDFIYYFKVTFHPGDNFIKHSYKYKGGLSIEMISSYDYRLTTGKMWANGQIDDFYLNVKFQDNTYASIPKYFQNNVPIKWNEFGISQIRDDLQNDKLIKAYFKTGGICTHIKNFKPDYDLDITILHVYPEDISFLYTGLIKSIESISDEELRVLRNSLFAKNGYIFKSADLYNYFSQFAWYFPDPNVKNDISILTNRDKEIFDKIISEIDKRNGD